MRQNTEHDFWRLVDQRAGHCWLFTGGRCGKWGMMNVSGRTVMAHRFVYETLVGQIPYDMRIVQTCRNTLCCNPDHLVLSYRAGTRSGIAEFWKRIRPSDTGCWLYEGSPTGGGYCVCQINHVPKFAHRLMYELAHGEIPDGLDVCHTCDVPNCVSPWHLFLGTHAENMLDSARKGRKNKKLTIPQARDIKHMISSGLGDRQIACQFGISRQTVNDMRHGKYRTYIPVPPQAMVPA